MEQHDAHCIAAQKHEAELSMAHYDNLPTKVRRAIYNALVNVDDLHEAARLGILQRPAAELVSMVRDANLAAYRHGVAHEGVAPQRTDFHLRARGAGRPDRIEKILERQRLRESLRKSNEKIS